MVGIKHVDNVHAKVPLEPNNITLSTVEHLDNLGVGEGLVQQVKRITKLQCVDKKVLITGRDLHQTDKSLERAVVVVLQIDSNLTLHLQSCTHVLQTLHSVDPDRSSRVEGVVQLLWSLLKHVCWVLQMLDFVLVRVRLRGQLGCVGFFQSVGEVDLGVGLHCDLSDKMRVGVVDWIGEAELRANNVLGMEKLVFQFVGLFVPKDRFGVV